MHVMGRVSTWRDSAETVSSRESVTSEASVTVLATLTLFWVHGRAPLFSLSTVGLSTSREFSGGS